MECPVGFSGNTIFEFYKKQGLDLRADLKKVPNNKHEKLVHFLSNCTLACLLCSRMLNCCHWSPPPAAATSAASARHRQRQRPGATAAASRWAVAAGPSRQPPALLLPCPLNNSMCTGHSCAFRAGFAHSGRTGNTACQA